MDLETRLARQEALEAIRRLKYERYCLAIDRGVCQKDASAFQPLLERLDANIDISFTGIGTMQGSEAAGEFFSKGVPSMLSWCQHRVSNPIIDIDPAGDTAQGIWYVFCPAVATSAGPTGSGPIVIVGRYEEAYRRVGDDWHWTKLHAQLDVLSGTAELWSNAAWAE